MLYSAKSNWCALVISCALLLLSLFIIRTSGQTVTSAPVSTASQKVDRSRLETVEDLSESLANDLLELSVATIQCDRIRTADFFPAQLTAETFPAQPLPLKDQVKWIASHGWNKSSDNGSGGPESKAERVAKTNPQAPGVISREQFLRGWSQFLAHFSVIEDARFKLKASTFDDAATVVQGAKVPTATVGSKGTARIAFYVIGRDTSGLREWARGVANVSIRYAENKRWQFVSFKLASLDSTVAKADLFSEVSSPAGIAASIPAYGAAGNTGFIWHGAAAADLNSDGWVDLFVTAGDRNYLYLNNGKGGFSDASDEANIKVLATGVAPLILDYDNDGDRDVFISTVGSQILLENRLVPDKKLEFRDVSLEAGVSAQAIGFSAISGDVNGDGYADIYVTSYNRYGQVTPDSWFRATNGTPNLLFISKGDGTFREEAAKWGVDDRRWSYAAEFADVNGDGRLDLYIANDFGEKGLYINKGERFVDEARERGVLDPGNGMGVSFGDYNNDGRLDIHATNMSSTAGNRILSRLFPASNAKDNVLMKLAAGNNLYENLGDGKFRDVTAEVGGFSGGWAWGGGFIDFDNDGWEDIFTPNGFISGKSMKDT